MAPASALNWISRPVFSACSRVTAGASSVWPSASMSIIWPPAMPRAPAAAPSASDQFAARLRVGMGVRLGQHLEGAGLQRVAGQDRGRLVEGLVACSACRGADRRRPSPAGRRAPANRRAASRPTAATRAAQVCGRRRTARRVSITRKARSRLPPPKRGVAHRLDQPALGALDRRQQVRPEPVPRARRSRAISAGRSYRRLRSSSEPQSAS